MTKEVDRMYTISSFEWGGVGNVKEHIFVVKISIFIQGEHL